MASTPASLFSSEVLLFSTASSSQLVGSLALTNLAAPSSTSTLISFKGLSDPSAHSVDFIPTSPNAALGATGGLVFQLEANKAVLNIYSWQKDHPVIRVILPQKLSCLSVSPDGEFLAAASHDGRIFLWQISTGDLLSSFDAHYRAITVLKWSSDGAALITASQDARILVWSVQGLLAPSQQSSSSITSTSNNPSPYCTLADHNLAITDLAIGSGRFPHQLTILSASQDATVKLWDIRTRSLVTTFAFEQPIVNLVLDPTERFFFASTSPASNQNAIYRVDLFRKKPVSSGHTNAATAGTTSSSFSLTSLETWEPRVSSTTGGDMERILNDDSSRIATIQEPITALCLSLSATFLCVGTGLGNLYVMDVTNSQILKAVSLLGHSKNSNTNSLANAVTNLRALPKPRDLFGSWEFSSSTGGASLPIRPVSQFSRTVVTEDQRSQSVLSLRLSAQPAVENWILPSWDHDSLSSFSTSNFPSSSLLPSAATDSNSSTSDSQHDQVVTLRSQLTRAKQINHQLWDTIVSASLVPPSSSS